MKASTLGPEHDESLEKETPAGHNTILTYILTWFHVNSLGVFI